MGAPGDVNDSLANDTYNGTRLVHMEVGLSDSIEAYVVPSVFAVIFIVGVVGNGTLIFTVLRNKAMRSTPNIFIVSLAIGDMLLILVSVPFTSTIYTFTEWPYGLTVCKLNEFLQTLSLGVSIFTLTALSGDRYVAIVYPMSKHKGSPTLRTLCIAGAIWLLSLLLALPDAISAHIKIQRMDNHLYEVCDLDPREWPKWYPQFHAAFRFVVYFGLPVLIIMVFYVLMAHILIKSSNQMPVDGQRGCGQATRQMEARKKVARLVLSFVFVFMFCWLPRHIYVMWWCFDTSEFTMQWHILKITGFCLAFINSCVNPIALYFLSKQFRCYYTKYLCRCCTKEGRDSHGASPGLLSQTHSEGGHSQNLYNFKSMPAPNSRHTSTSMILNTTQSTC